MRSESFPLKDGGEVELKLLHLGSVGPEDGTTEEILLVDVEDVNKKYARYDFDGEQFEEREQYLLYEDLQARRVNYHLSRLKDRYIEEIGENGGSKEDHLEVATENVEPALDSNRDEEPELESDSSRLDSTSELEDNEAYRSEERNNNYEEDNEAEGEEDEYNENVRPYNPKDIQIKGAPLSLRHIKDLIDAGDIDLQPDYQRAAVWNRTRNSLLIESILLCIPLPTFYFSKDEEGKYQVIDGQQRLTAIYNYMKCEYSLKGMDYLTSAYYKGDEIAEGCYYKSDRYGANMGKCNRSFVP